MSHGAEREWVREAEDLWVHPTGARIARTTYQQKEGWFLMPAELERSVLRFDPTPDGLAGAFAAFSSPTEGGRPRPATATSPRRRSAARDEDSE